MGGVDRCPCRRGVDAAGARATSVDGAQRVLPATPAVPEPEPVMPAELPEDERGSAADLETALRSVLPSFVVRDEHLELAPAPGLGAPGASPRRAQLAGVDGDGRATLVLLAEGEEAVLAAIDALSWSNAHAALLTRRIGSTPELAPCIVLVAPRFEARIVAALETLRVAGVRVFETRSACSAYGEDGAQREDSALVEIAGPRAVADPQVEGEIWTAPLEAGARELAQVAARGLDRIDPTLRGTRGVRGIVWRRDGASLWTLRARGDRLEAEVQGDRMLIDGPDDIERVLERALRAVLELPEERGTNPILRPRRAASSLMPSGPLLSEAELAALRGP